MDIHVRNGAYKGPVRAVILDWAGTAVDYGCMGPVAVFMEVFKRQGVEVTTAEARGPMGHMKKDHVRLMCEAPTIQAKWRAVHGRGPEESDVEAMYLEVEPLMTACVSQHAAPIPGVLDALATLRAQGIKVGSSTGYTTPMMEVLVREARRLGYVPDAVVCSSDVPAGRPLPWMCYLNAIRLEVFPMEAMVKIGDTVADIQEGLNAGMWTIGVTKTGNELGLTAAQVETLPAEELSRRLAAIDAKLRGAGTHYVTEDVQGSLNWIEDINRRLARGERP